jgi:hypothetical protein
VCLDIHIEQEADLTVVNARTHLMLLLPPYCCSGDLFFTDWSDMDMNVRMKYWDRKFKTLLSYPQVSLAQGAGGEIFGGGGPCVVTTGFRRGDGILGQEVCCFAQLRVFGEGHAVCSCKRDLG